VYANELDSIKTQLPFPYYFLKYCSPTSDAPPKNTGENLGTILMGDTTQLTPYNVTQSVWV